MNTALEKLKRSNPDLYRTFTEALAENLGLEKRQAVASFLCPSCRTPLEITLPSKERATQRRRTGTALPPINALLIAAARAKKTTTGTVNTEFSQKFRKQIKKLQPLEVRNLKIKWLKSELARSRSKGQAA